MEHRATNNSVTLAVSASARGQPSCNPMSRANRAKDEAR
jgi:hypothetical protein